MTEAHHPTCSLCACVAPSVPPPLSWSSGVHEGHRAWICPECARANIRSIESRLDPAWW